MPPRQASTILRIIRSTVVSAKVKTLYDYHCQVSGRCIETPAGPYAEAAHVRPTGQPHNGPDHLSNLLCLCPNHHVMLDLGAIALETDLTVIPINTNLMVAVQHGLDPVHLAYHCAHFWNNRRTS